MTVTVTVLLLQGHSNEHRCHCQLYIMEGWSSRPDPHSTYIPMGYLNGQLNLTCLKL